MRVEHGDCLDVLPRLGAGVFDSCVTDPPYHLTTGKKGGTGPASLNVNSPAGRSRISTGGFMGKVWDGGDIAFRPETWAAVADVLKPGAHLLAFGGTRTFHRLAVAIEDAGFEIRDTIMWVYGSGFPKSHNQPGGWGTALKPAWEPNIVARKPLVGTVAANIALHGTGAINIDGCRIGENAGWSYPNGRGGSGWHGRESLAANLTEAMAATKGRWPANLIHDGSDEVLAGFPVTAPSKAGWRNNNNQGHEGWSGTLRSGPLYSGHADSGSAARFFYCAKASKADRAGSKHPTVKPLALMRYLCRLVTPPGGTVLDPFAGSGATLAAAVAEGFHAVGIEREAEYVADIRRRFIAPAETDLPLFDEPRPKPVQEAMPL